MAISSHNTFHCGLLSIRVLAALLSNSTSPMCSKPACSNPSAKPPAPANNSILLNIFYSLDVYIDYNKK